VKVLLGIPTSGAPSAPFLESLAAANITSFERMIVPGNFISAQRELITERALAIGADVLVMCDDDMVIPPHAFAELLGVLRNDSACGIAGALYYSRDGFRPMAVDDWSAENTTTASVPAFASRPVRVAGIGFGCVAISCPALARMKPPYFDTHVYIESDPPRVRVCNEDYLFCAKLRAAGYDVVLHAGVRCGHYDRSSDRVFPLQWEDESTTNQRRVAVNQNGTSMLVPYREIAAAAERHDQASLTYVRPLS
jgi:GT2 family glycosyltransferase